MKRTILIAAAALLVGAGLSAQNAEQNQNRAGNRTEAQTRTEKQNRSGATIQSETQGQYKNYGQMTMEQKQTRHEERKALKRQQKEMKREQNEKGAMNAAGNRLQNMKQQRSMDKNNGTRKANLQGNPAKGPGRGGQGGRR